MQIDTILFALLLGAAVFSLSCWPASIEKLIRSNGYLSTQKAMYVLSTIHWLVGISLLIWVSPNQLSSSTVVDIAIDNWMLISTSSFYTFLGWRYTQAAKWLKCVEQKNQQLKDTLFVATDNR